MSNRAFLISNNTPTPAGRTSDGKSNYALDTDVIAEGGGMLLPPFWLSLFDESHLTIGESPMRAALCTTNRQAQDAVTKVLLANGANPNCATRPSVPTDYFMRDCRTRGETPLHRAAAFGTEATIQMLLDAGARIDAKDMNGDSALSWASRYLRPRSILKKLCYGEFRA